MLSRASPKSLANLGSSKQNLKSPSQNSPQSTYIVPVVQSSQLKNSSYRLGKQTNNHPKQLKKVYDSEPFLIRNQQFQKQKAIKLAEQQRRRLYADATLQPKKNIIRKKEAVNNDVIVNHEHYSQKSKSYKEMYYKRHGKELPSSKQKSRQIPKNYEQLLRESVSRFNSKFVQKEHDVDKKTKKQKLSDIQQKIRSLRQRLKLQDSILQQQSLEISRISYEQGMKSDKNHSQLLQKVINQIQNFDDYEQNPILTSFKKLEVVSDTILLEQPQQQQKIETLNLDEDNSKLNPIKIEQNLQENVEKNLNFGEYIQQQEYFFNDKQNQQSKNIDKIQDHQQINTNNCKIQNYDQQKILLDDIHPEEEAIKGNKTEVNTLMIKNPSQNITIEVSQKVNTTYALPKAQDLKHKSQKPQQQLENSLLILPKSIETSAIKVVQDQEIKAQIKQEPLKILTPSTIVKLAQIKDIQTETEISQQNTIMPIIEITEQQDIDEQQNSEATVNIIRQSFFDMQGNYIQNVQVQSLDFGLCRFLCAQNGKDEEKVNLQP